MRLENKANVAETVNLIGIAVTFELNYCFIQRS